MSPRWPNEPKSDAPDAETEPVRYPAPAMSPMPPPAAASAAAGESLAEEPKVAEHGKKCPNCDAEMVQHGDANPYKAGCWHCNGCGCCWAPDLKTVREGHPTPLGFKA